MIANNPEYPCPRIPGELQGDEAPGSVAPIHTPQDPLEAMGIINGECGNLIILPGSGVTLSDTAGAVFRRMARGGKIFTTGDSVCEIVPNGNGGLIRRVIPPEALCSRLDAYGKLMSIRMTQRGPVLRPDTCSMDTAKKLMASEEAHTLLPRLNKIVNIPLLAERSEKLVVLPPGFDRETGIYVACTKPLPEIPLAEAVEKLKDLHTGFDFESPADLSRAIASILTPYFKLCGFIRGNVPIDVAEAKQSQSGKGYRLTMLAGIYGEKPNILTQQNGGVGSIAESLKNALIEARPFILLDNFRGDLNEPFLESFTTASQSGFMSVRAPYGRYVSIDPNGFFLLLSSNGFHSTEDLANRSNIIRIRKRPKDYPFKKYPEGDILQHVAANFLYYLGCVAAVVKEWYGRGKPVSDGAGHDFREWHSVLNWVVPTLFQLPPIMEGHDKIKERLANPTLGILRRLAIAIAASGEWLGEQQSASDLVEICKSSGIEFAGRDESGAHKILGAKLGHAFKPAETLELGEGYTVTRVVTTRTANGEPAKYYVFNREGASPIRQSPMHTSENGGTSFKSE